MISMNTLAMTAKNAKSFIQIDSRCDWWTGPDRPSSISMNRAMTTLFDTMIALLSADAMHSPFMDSIDLVLSKPPDAHIAATRPYEEQLLADLLLYKMLYHHPDIGGDVLHEVVYLPNMTRAHDTCTIIREIIHKRVDTCNASSQPYALSPPSGSWRNTINLWGHTVYFSDIQSMRVGLKATGVYVFDAESCFMKPSVNQCQVSCAIAASLCDRGASVFFDINKTANATDY